MKLGKYEYYRDGHQYHVFAIALDTVHKEYEVRNEDGSITHMPTVLYRALYAIEDLKEQFGEYPYFTRTLPSFTSMVEHEGKMVPMFTYVGPME